MESIKKIKLNSTVNKLIILLLLFHSFLSGTNLDEIQIFCEVIIIANFTFFFIIYKVKFLKFEILTSIILFATSLISCFINPIYVAILNAKVYFIAIGSILFFTKFELKPYYIKFTLLVNFCFILYQYIYGNLPFALILNPIIGAFGQYVDSRPLGLFLNTHFSAYFLAIYLIYIGYKKKLFGIGIAILYLTMSKFTLSSYIIHLIMKSKIIAIIKKYFKNIILVITILFVFFTIKYSEDIIKLDLGSAYSSFNTIAEQILKIDSYTTSFSLFPDDTNKIFEAFTNEAGNEVMYFTLIFQGGIILFVFYIIYFISKLKHFKVFVLISMLHYGFSMSPLIIFLIIMYNSKIEKLSLLNE